MERKAFFPNKELEQLAIQIKNLGIPCVNHTEVTD